MEYQSELQRARSLVSVTGTSQPMQVEWFWFRGRLYWKFVDTLMIGMPVNVKAYQGRRFKSWLFEKINFKCRQINDLLYYTHIWWTTGIPIECKSKAKSPLELLIDAHVDRWIEKKSFTWKLQGRNGAPDYDYHYDPKN